MAYGRRTGVPVTFRAGGTSLNGQAQGDGIMVDVRRHWRGVTVEEDGRRARVLPGTVLGHANAALAPHGRRLGPDPASHGHRDGRRSDREQLRRHALRRRARLLPDRALADVRAAVGHDDRHRAAGRRGRSSRRGSPSLRAAWREIRDEIRADAELAERIRRKFEIKNTTGYRLVAFLDADEPLEIFRRLLVGSEGTLGVRLRGGVRHGAVRAARDDGVRALPDDRRGGRVRAAAGRGGRERHRADDGALDEGGAGVRRRSRPSGTTRPNDAAAILVEFRSDDEAELAAREARGAARCSTAARWSSRRSSRATPS